jgi:hypothetical protein
MTNVELTKFAEFLNRRSQTLVRRSQLTDFVNYENSVNYVKKRTASKKIGNYKNFVYVCDVFL